MFENNKLDLDWPNIECDLEKLNTIERNGAIMDLIKGVGAMLFSSVLFTLFMMMVIMTPDPDGLIHYKGAFAILMILFFIFLYSIKKICDVEKFLKQKGN
jgi:hypothetical protein